MMSNVKVLAVITARGGSKGLPGKNIKLLGKKHLIGWTIDAALKANCIDKVIVSTDCPNIAKISKEYGAEIPFLRPDSLASDTATSIDTVLRTIHHPPDLRGKNQTQDRGRDNTGRAKG